MGQKVSGMQCCHQGGVGGRQIAELTLSDMSPEDMAYVHVQEHPFDANFPGEPTWGCCSTHDASGQGLSAEAPAAASMLESLSYVPVRFDEGTTMDVERSHARYSKIVVHSTRARTQRRSKAWEEWLRGATAGREVVLLEGFENLRAEKEMSLAASACNKVHATYFLDSSLSKFSILPKDAVSSPSITLPIDNIQVICPVSDFMVFFDRIETHLDESEKTRAVLLQYVTEEAQRRRVCFLEESERAKDHCVQALTALWLEKRNDHSMWF